MSKDYEIEYEWTVERIDEHGDIQDVAFFDTPDEMIDDVLDARADGEGERIVFGLLERMGNDDEGTVERGYAYINQDDGLLPDNFDNGSIVPARFKIELRKAWEKPAPVMVDDDHDLSFDEHGYY